MKEEFIYFKERQKIKIKKDGNKYIETKYSRKVNEKKVEYYCANKDLYNLYDNIKIEFDKYFNKKEKEVDMDLFISNIENYLKKITYIINTRIFDGNNIEWEESDTYVWVMKCFCSTNTNSGYIIQLYNKNIELYEKYFCNCCKNTLKNLIVVRIKYLIADKRYCNNILSVDGGEYMKELEDLKDYITDINTEQDLLKFGDKYLIKKELLVLSLVLYHVIKQNQSYDKYMIMKELNLTDKGLKKLILSIRNKYKQYKIDNNIR